MVIRLVTKTGLTAEKALAAEDTPELLAKVMRGYRDLTGAEWKDA